MKHKTLPSILTATVLSFLLAFGGIRCLSTAFSIEISLSALILHSLLWAMTGSFLFSRPKIGWIVLPVLGLLGFWLWRKTELVDQVLGLAYRITHEYDAAYRTGWLGRPTDVDSFALPLYVWAGLNALLGSWCLTRRRFTAVAIIASLLPHALCLVLTDTIPSTGSLFCLLLGVTLVLLTAKARRSQAPALTWMLSIPAALALLLLFLFNPQASYDKQHYADQMGDALLRAVDRIPYVDFGEDGAVRFSFTQHIPGFVDLQNKGPNRQFPVPVMEVTAEYSGYLYLRGRDYDIYTGTQWDASSDRNEPFTSIQDNLNPGIRPLGELTIKTSGSLSSRYLPYYPDTSYLLQGGACNNLGNVSVYSYNWYALPEHYYTPTLNWQNTVSWQAGFSIYSGYLQLPEATKTWAEDYLADHLTVASEDATVDNVAKAIADLVQGSAIYDLNTQRMPDDSEDFARWFLEESETGYCVHFATATTVLLRAAGIPARYVEGYLAETVSGRTVTVTERDAHAWAEYYVPGIGWIPLESTAGAAEDIPVTTQPTEQTTQPTEETTTAPTETDPSTAPSEDTTRPSKVTEIPTDTTAGTAPAKPQPGDQKPVSISKSLVIALALASLLLVQYPVRLRLREKYLRSGSPNARALKYWCDTRRLARLAKQTPPEDLEELALRAKFSQHTLTEEDLVPFDLFRQKTAAQLRCQRWWKRLYHRFIRAAY